jgi:ribosomal protein L1
MHAGSEWAALRVHACGCARAQVNEIKASVKFQLKKVLCMGVAIGNVAMEEKEVYVNTQARSTTPSAVPRRIQRKMISSSRKQ